MRKPVIKIRLGSDREINLGYTSHKKAQDLMEEGGNSALFNMVADIQDSFYQNDVLLGIEVTVEGSKPFHLPCYRQPQLRNKQAA